MILPITNVDVIGDVIGDVMWSRNRLYILLLYTYSSFIYLFFFLLLLFIFFGFIGKQIKALNDDRGFTFGANLQPAGSRFSQMGLSPGDPGVNSNRA